MMEIVRSASRPCAPPSVLPDISPSRGEISFHAGVRQPPALEIRAGIRDGVISPLEGEMSGRTEGGDLGRKTLKASYAIYAMGSRA